MQIKIPDRLLSAYDRYEAWVNVPIWKRGRVELRRIDIILAAGFVFCVGWYGYTSGWRGALLGGVMYVVMAMVALWML